MMPDDADPPSSPASPSGPPEKQPGAPTPSPSSSKKKRRPERVSSKRPDAPPGKTSPKAKKKRKGNPKAAQQGGARPRTRKTDARRPGNPNLGAPTRLTSDVQKLYVEAIMSGAFRDHAAAYAGIDRHTVNDWLKWGARHRAGVGRDGTGHPDRRDKPFADFHAAIERAEALHARDLTSLVHKAAEGSLSAKLAPDWQAAKFLLTHRHRDLWADKVEVHAVHEQAKPEADRIADAVLADRTLQEDLTAALSRITTRLQEARPAAASTSATKERKGST